MWVLVAVPSLLGPALARWSRVDATGVPMTARDGTADGAHDTLAAREFFAAALYLALVLLAALVVLPAEWVPDDAALVGTMVGTAVGLVLAHWLAFRLAVQLTADGGFAAASAAREAGAQILGGVAVALVAALPFVVLDGEDALGSHWSCWPRFRR
jgi:hypothetical protein